MRATCYAMAVPARPIASGNVSFGLVSIPVKLFSTSESSTGIHFNWLDAKHGVRLKQQYISTKDERVVPREERIKGYEFAKGQYVTFTDEELKDLSEKASPTIDISEFIPLSEIDPLYYQKAYFLGPESGAEKAYTLLAQAMKKTDRCAVARYAARGKMYIVLLRPFGPGIVMQQLFYNDEIRKFDEVPLGDEVAVKKGELDLAIQLIEQIASAEFDADDYEDEVRTRVWQAIQHKVDGEEITATIEEQPKAQIVDLMEALKASLGVGDERSGPQPVESRSSAAKPSSRKPPRRSPRTTARRPKTRKKVAAK